MQRLTEISKEPNVILPTFRKLVWNSVSGSLECYQCMSSHYIILLFKINIQQIRTKRLQVKFDSGVLQI